ncbi:MAG: NAD-dependent epimerase/dehydratase family protein [Candidatus ainarchaeum sp.]|nr:NAD-dependent epimerase/dehydratase family protein [Candidatus ainarchaeum sp.]
MIYITGANGRLGKEVLKLLPEAIPLVRKKSGSKKEIVTDFSEKELKEILKNAKIMVHLAGSMNFLDHNELWETNVKLTERIVNSLPKNSKIIFSSSISVYGKRIAELPADEKTKINPDTPYSKSKDFAEKIISKHKNYVILRIGTIYGKGFEDYYMILKMIEKGNMYLIGDGENKIPFVHVEDVAYAIKNAINRGKGIYVLTGECKKQREIIDMASSELKVKTVLKRVPESFALMFAKAEEIGAKMEKRKPKITQEHIMVLSSDRDFDCSKAKKELNFKPRKIEKGIREMVKNYKNKRSRRE